jgi:polyhydroxyalkanoate synthesis regulator phasin
MAERADSRGSVETLFLAGVGTAARLAERADQLAEVIAQRLGVDPAEVRAAVTDVLDSWRREVERLGEHAQDAPKRVASDVGLATREALAELELRVARVEHRLKLLERDE